MRTADLSHRKDTRFDVAPLPETIEALIRDLDLSALRKMRLSGAVEPVGARNFRLRARLGATVVQPCVVTLAPVTTRIEADVERMYVDGLEAPEGDEVEMPEDESLEPLGPEIDLLAILAEALALNLPAYPRAEGVEAGEMVFAEPGVAPMRDADVKPFAALKALRDKLGDGES
ncbi:50S ribosomal protein L34 [Pseudaestuariivita atlantica]|uniref:50S ribosomal protein L34 n=1 Tax=Pseudaestuariivita atlantica TaxID=1317121 RepID=A0A0L1JV86_9RHOB|nr:50S ribosomal protein L34 [Pseudaestuariivita atlantica]